MAPSLLSRFARIAPVLFLAGCLEEPPAPRGAFFQPESPALRTEGPIFVSEAEFVFVDSQGKRWIAPQGTRTDGASIPQWALSVTGDRMDVGYRSAALVHDAYCQGSLNGDGPSFRKETWQNVHRMFYEACVANGVSPARARLLFSAVWIGGPRWGEDGDAPEGLALSTQEKTEKLQAVADQLNASAAAAEHGDYRDLEGLMGLLASIEKDLAEIKATTARIETKTDQVLASVQDMSASFAVLARQGGVIPDPKTPEQHYHNARLHELGGDYGNARRAYLAFFAFDPDALDPHLRFQDFLKLQEGRAGARETYALIAGRSKSIVPRYASILLGEREERIPQLEAFLAEHPEFPPALYHLGQEYSAARLGTPSLDDKRRERDLLERFLAASKDGKLLRWFIDQEVPSAWIADAETRLTAVKASVSDAVLAAPVELRWMHTNGGWMGSIVLAEPAREIFWQGPGTNEFRSTGFMPNRDPRTGLPMPMMTLSLPDGTAKSDVRVKYTNGAGTEMGPFTLPFDPDAATLTEAKHILELTKTSWVSFRDFDGKTLLYFSHLLGHRGALQEIRYGLDRDDPDRTHPFPPHLQPGHAPITEDVVIYIEVPSTTKFATVRLLFRDGTASEAVRFNR